VRVPVLCLAIVATLALAAGAGGANVVTPATPALPVPSLEPAKTAALWQSLVGQQPRAARSQAACRPLRAVFYAASDYRSQ